MLRPIHRKISLFLIAIGIGYLYLSFQLPSYPYVPVDADAVPITLGLLLIILASLLFFSPDRENKEEKQKRTIPKEHLLKLLGVFGLLIAYISLLEIIGFVIVSALFIFLCTRFLGYSRHVTNGIVSIAFSIGLYSIFNFLLRINLPQGILPF